MEKNSINTTQWLRSPITEKQFRMGMHQELLLTPYFGAKKKIILRYTRYQIGSGAEADLRLYDPYVSKSHAQLRLGSDGGFLIEDLDSKNGIFLNGTKIQRAKLPSSGSLRLGRSTISWGEKTELGVLGDLGSFWVADEGMKQALLKLKLIAQSNIPILLLGETGTGKELLAKLIHRWGSRSSGSLVPINGALAGGGLVDSELFGHKKGAYTGSESSRVGALLAAHNGTLFLDEVADLPLDTQVKLLRALEGGEVKALGSDKIQHADFRLVTATSQSIEALVESKQFRLDLFYRISGFTLRIPPLRERPADIRWIAKKILEKKGLQLSAEAEAKLLSHVWPGNVRELHAVLNRSILLAAAEKEHFLLPAHIDFTNENQCGLQHQVAEKKCSLEEIEKFFIQKSLERNSWSRSIVAQELGIARSTLFEKMRKYGLRDKVP